jgi:uncharacterized protein YqeY
MTAAALAAVFVGHCELEHHSMLKEKITADMKSAMREGDKQTLGVVRMAMAAIKQKEVDDRVSLDDAAVLAIIEKMVKQRRESISQYEQGGRPELAAREAAEIEVLQRYLPEPLSRAELEALIDKAIEDTGAESMRDMGRVMGVLKAEAQGRADMAEVSTIIKARLQ